MRNREVLRSLSQEQLIDLIEAYAKDWLAMDGVWFQSVERKYGMEEAMFHDAEAWKVFTKVEARRIKRFLNLPDQAGLEGLQKALALRLYAHINQDEIRLERGALLYRTLQCRVQQARIRKGMPLHPCKPVGMIEYAGFAQVIDSRIRCECVSCYPDITETDCCCAWRFTLEEDPTERDTETKASERADRTSEV